MSRQSKVLQIFLSHRAELLGYASRITGDRMQAEDVLQEAWLRFRATDADRPMEEPVGYLRRIVRNLAFDGQRRKSLEGRIFAEDAAPEAATVAGDAPTPETVLIAESELAIVSEALAQMPERMRAAVEMHRIRGMKLKEVAAALGISLTTAHELVAQGVEWCRSALRQAS